MLTIGDAHAMELTLAEADLLRGESGFRLTAKNPNSTAFGVWQCIRSTCEKYAAKFGFDPKTTDAEEQITMFRAYVKATYGTVERAVAFKEATVLKNAKLAPIGLQSKAEGWIAKGYVGY